MRYLIVIQKFRKIFFFVMVSLALFAKTLTKCIQDFCLDKSSLKFLMFTSQSALLRGPRGNLWGKALFKLEQTHTTGRKGHWREFVIQNLLS